MAERRVRDHVCAECHRLANRRDYHQRRPDPAGQRWIEAWLKAAPPPAPSTDDRIRALEAELIDLHYRLDILEKCLVTRLRRSSYRKSWLRGQEVQP
jgi:hypothetical protein